MIKRSRRVLEARLPGRADKSSRLSRLPASWCHCSSRQIGSPAAADSTTSLGKPRSRKALHPTSVALAWRAPCLDAGTVATYSLAVGG